MASVEAPPAGAASRIRTEAPTALKAAAAAKCPAKKGKSSNSNLIGDPLDQSASYAGCQSSSFSPSVMLQARHGQGLRLACYLGFAAASRQRNV